ncbi:MAG: HAMP domain-containing sensor histidine kinase [Pseudomonadota bacterium]
MAVWRSLSGRLLILTIIFVMIAEILIFVPSVARYREGWLRERLEKAQIASLALLAAPRNELPRGLEAELLSNAEVYSISLKRDAVRELMLETPTPKPIAPEPFDLRNSTSLELIVDALSCVFQWERRFIRVIGKPQLLGGEWVEIVVDEGELKRAMMAFGVRIFWLSLFISALTAVLVFFSVNAWLVRPVRRIIDNMTAFGDDPENSDRIIQPSADSGEIGSAERELKSMQKQVRKALQQKARLAALGEAVAKINHDLRNNLASAQLLADRLETSKDPIAARVTPKLLNSLDRAIRLCQNTLEFGRADEPEPERRQVALQPLVQDVADALGLAPLDDASDRGEAALRFRNHVDEDVVLFVDPDQLFRALLNLARNAVQAIEASGTQGEVAVLAGRVEPTDDEPARDGIAIDLSDTGPGIPEKTQENLFKPFRGSARVGGSGLGLAIAAELVRAQGGDLTLVETGSTGTRFRIYLPNGPQS